MFDKAAAVPEQQAVGEKRPLELVVQLIKRWRDLYYAGGNPDLAPISIVLTTLAGHAYNGEQSVSKALTSVLTATGLITAASSSVVPVRPTRSMGQNKYLRQRPLTPAQQAYFLKVAFPGSVSLPPGTNFDVSVSSGGRLAHVCRLHILPPRGISFQSYTSVRHSSKEET
jgi:hypothetical protein